MTIESAIWENETMIRVVVDGEILHVPDDLANRHRQELAVWEAEGNTIEPYSPPAQAKPAPEEMMDVTRAEFDALEARVAALEP